MKTHVKIVGWLWIANGAFGILIAIIGLIIANLNIPGAQDAILVTVGSLCVFLPGIIADFVAGYSLLQYKSWARILAIILGIFNLAFLCWLVLPALLGIYTLIIMFNEETVALFKGEAPPAENKVVN